MYLKYILIGVIFFLLGCAPIKESDLASEIQPASSTIKKTSKDLGVKIEPVGKVLTLKQALLLSLAKNPTLARFPWKIKAAEARILQSTFWSNPEFAVELEEFAGRDDRQAFDATELTIQFSQKIELGGKISKKTKIASIEKDLINWDYEEKRLEIFTITGKAFLATLMAQEKVKLAKDLLNLANKIHDTVSRRVDSGKVSPIELTRINVLVANSEIDWEKENNYLHMAKQNLSSLWENLEPKFEKVTGDFYKINLIPSLQNLEKRIVNNPKIARIKKEIEKEKAIVDLEESQKIPDVDFDLGVRFFSETDDQALVAGFSLPLPIFNRNQGNILSAKYNVKEIATKERSIQLEIRSSLAKSYGEVSISLMEIKKLKEHVLNNSESIFEAIRKGYQQGKFGYLEVLDAQRGFFEMKSRHIEAFALYHMGVMKIESLIAGKINIQGDEK